MSLSDVVYVITSLLNMFSDFVATPPISYLFFFIVAIYGLHFFKEILYINYH